MMQFQNRAIHSPRQPEIIRIHNQSPHSPVYQPGNRAADKAYFTVSPHPVEYAGIMESKGKVAHTKGDFALSPPVGG